MPSDRLEAFPAAVLSKARGWGAARGAEICRKTENGEWGMEVKRDRFGRKIDRIFEVWRCLLDGKLLPKCGEMGRGIGMRSGFDPRATGFSTLALKNAQSRIRSIFEIGACIRSHSKLIDDTPKRS